jgi:hypothetical protein
METTNYKALHCSIFQFSLVSFAYDDKKKTIFSTPCFQIFPHFILNTFIFIVLAKLLKSHNHYCQNMQYAYNTYLVFILMKSHSLSTTRITSITRDGCRLENSVLSELNIWIFLIIIR